MNTHQERIKQIRAQLIEARRVKEVRKRHAKADAERFNAEVVLILDDMQLEGLDLTTEMGCQVFVRILFERAGILKPNDRLDL